jgi:H/ACA ribonucleoprotein complex subunit 3
VVHILKCKSCGNYGLEEVCTCGSKRVRIEPAKYSPLDKYAEYRRKAKESEAEDFEAEDFEEDTDEDVNKVDEDK